MLPNPMIIIDEAGDLDYNAFLVLKELWNATEGTCGWYMMGADGLRNKIERGIAHKQVGYKEIFSRYSERYTSVVPSGTTDRMSFYRKLITDVLSVNMTDTTNLNRDSKTLPCHRWRNHQRAETCGKLTHSQPMNTWPSVQLASKLYTTKLMKLLNSKEYGRMYWANQRPMAPG